RSMVNKDYWKRFKKPIILINTARGEIVSLADLAEAMELGTVRGAVLDVLENEKLGTLTPVQEQAFNRLRKRSDVIFTPHIAGWTFESHVKINVALVLKIKSLPLV
ncbi:MAG TPA: NAD(P)-dependent oxidoreductase, partial [Chryseolinea sp.]|nr:NAD(P)-dependent oxidoreductase [Chryseolinea sp.]